MNKTKIDKINQVLGEFFEKNKNIKRIPALDMMEHFVEAGVFNTDYDRHGLPIRRLLRELDKNNQLSLIPYVVVERKSQKNYWFFEPLK